MSPETNELVGSVVAFTLGVFFLIGSNRIGKIACAQQQKLFHIKSGERSFQIGFFLGGTIFLAIGVSSLFFH